MVDQPATPLAIGKSGPHLPQLDSLRGLACLMVLFAHLKAVRFMHWVPDFLGDAGVGVFFVLSGFLITRILVADRAAGRSLTGFYNRRVARIFPIYFLTLAVLAVTWPGKEVSWAADFTFNFRFNSLFDLWLKLDFLDHHDRCNNCLQIFEYLDALANLEVRNMQRMTRIKVGNIDINRVESV